MEWGEHINDKNAGAFGSEHDKQRKARQDERDKRDSSKDKPKSKG